MDGKKWNTTVSNFGSLMFRDITDNLSFELFVLQVSVSTVSTKHIARSETPSSILSSDSDIRFTRKLGAHYRCGCCILAVFLLFLLLAAAAVYLGCK
jgi:hypothetical protein